MKAAFASEVHNGSAKKAKRAKEIFEVAGAEDITSSGEQRVSDRQKDNGASPIGLVQTSPGPQPWVARFDSKANGLVHAL